MDGFLTRKNVQNVKNILESPDGREKMIRTNYEVAKRHYSFAMIRRWLHTLLKTFLAWIVDFKELVVPITSRSKFNIPKHNSIIISEY